MWPPPFDGPCIGGSQIKVVGVGGGDSISRAVACCAANHPATADILTLADLSRLTDSDESFLKELLYQDSQSGRFADGCYTDGAFLISAVQLDCRQIGWNGCNSVPHHRPPPRSAP